MPVDGGIAARSKRGSIGETWWSQRFIALLESFGVGSRLQRVRSYALRGQVVELEVEPGVVLAVNPLKKADARTRTGDPFITSEVLYQLSYVGGLGLGQSSGGQVALLSAREASVLARHSSARMAQRSWSRQRPPIFR